MPRIPTKYRDFTIRPAQLAAEYDVILIGAGIGGLSCGAYLAKGGAKVLIAERHSLPGGLCSFFKRGGFCFDAGAHYFGGLGNVQGFGGVMLRALGLDVEFIRLDPVDIFHFPDRTLELPAELESHIELLQQTFPHERENIPSFFKEMLRIYKFFYRGKFDSEVLSLYRWTTYQDVLDHYFKDETLKAILSATVGYIGVYPAQVSAIAMASMMMSYFCDGGYIARGGSQSLPDSIMRRFASDGGHLLLNAEVKEVVVKGDRATHIVLDSGQEVRGRVFVSNADPQKTFSRLTGENQLAQDYLKKLRTYRESNSSFILYLGLKLDDEALRGKRGWHWDSYKMNDPENNPLYIAIPTLEDKSLCPPEHNILIATIICDDPREIDGPGQDENWWTQYKNDCASNAMKRLERIIPGIAQHIVVQESATYRTIHRYTLNSRGAMYGWESSPNQYAINGLPIQTPFENLFLCGHWTLTGPGVVAVFASGFMVARKVHQLFQQTQAPQPEPLPV